ncbi:MAG: signal transduction histidine kinase, partial [Planctomycetota bacterium]
TISMLEAKIEEKNICLQRQGWDHDQELEVDPDLMEQALYCLLANAVEASEEGGSIFLTLRRGEAHFQFSIRDNGPGLPFEPQQGNLEPGPSTKKFGTGLGIPVAFKICQSHGWELSFNSDESGTEAVITCINKANEFN